MSLNVYDCEERISYNPQKPISYWGFCITTSGSHDTVCPFVSTEKRDEWVELVRRGVEWEDAEDEGYHCAALTALATLGNEGSSQEWGDWMLKQYFADEREAALEAVKDFEQ
jgi:hypothetical protein